MSKRLIICCDGTWNTPDQQTAGDLTPTNVTKLALAVAESDGAGIEQRAFYHRGVGTDRWDHLIGGGFGLGLSRDVRDTYRFIVDNYEPGDELFFFGFSRGAFTARSTAGFVRNSGILKPEETHRLNQAYALYRSRSAAPRTVEATLFRKSFSYETRIRFIGVWDTVGALGIPMAGGRLVNALKHRWEFHDTDLSTTVESAYQALAIDERRGPFVPTIWHQQPDAVGQHLEQVWFAGVHSDVGGGYPKDDLSNIALHWLAERAQACGLALTESPALDPSWVTGTLHDSFKGVYRYLEPHRRSIGTTEAGSEFLASTAEERHESAGYSPDNVVAYLASDDHQLMPIE